MTRASCRLASNDAVTGAEPASSRDNKQDWPCFSQLSAIVQAVEWTACSSMHDAGLSFGLTKTEAFGEGNTLNCHQTRCMTSLVTTCHPGCLAGHHCSADKTKCPFFLHLSLQNFNKVTLTGSTPVGAPLVAPVIFASAAACHWRVHRGEVALGTACTTAATF